MSAPYHYETITEALSQLKNRGFTLDFNLEENCIVCAHGKFDPEDLEIVEFYRYEGTSDPADESIVYALESKSGIKGVLVNAFGLYGDSRTQDTMKRLQFRTRQ
jgi:hypothetical protein